MRQGVIFCPAAGYLAPPKLQKENMTPNTSFLAVVGGCIFATSIIAAQVDPNDSAEQWRKTTAADRFTYAKKASTFCVSSNCGSVEIRACMDEVVRPPVLNTVERMTIGELAAACIAMLRAQR